MMRTDRTSSESTGRQVAGEAARSTGPGPTSGLTDAEAESARASFGYNEIPEPKAHPLRRLLSKFWGVSAWMLEFIVGLSAYLGKYAELAIVAALLIVNALLSLLQEHRAQSVVAALRKRVSVTARVRRSGAWKVLPARELVPGDWVRVRAGDIVPADIEVAEGTISADQSALTGESTSVPRKAGETLFSGSLVRRGEAAGNVTATGTHTYFGRTTHLVQTAEPVLHVEAVIAKVVRTLFAIVAATLMLVIALMVARGTPLVETLPLMLVLLMGAVPVALPVMFTVSMAMGAKALAKEGVLVTRLSAAEDAATMDVLCVDKTGTITTNQLAIARLIPMEGWSEDDVLFAGALASEEANQDPIDLAFLTLARERRIYDRNPKIVPISFAPFDARSRRTEAVIDAGAQRLRVTKGAVRTIAEICQLGFDDLAALEARAGQSAPWGYRTLAVARGAPGAPPALVGLVNLYDPPRADAAQLIAALRARGISVKMLTGDALPVAQKIARDVGLMNIQRMPDLRTSEGNTTKTPQDILRASDGVAEVFPEGKYTILKHLQASGHVSGMTGDGVNDAPALRQAEVGIAVSTATDVTKAAASVILTEPGLTNIVALVDQGRMVYQRVLTWIINKISRTLLTTAFVAVAFLATGQFVISAFGMVLLLFLMDFAKIALATDNVHPSPAPETWSIGGYVALSVLLGTLMLLEVLLLFWLGWTHLGLASDPLLLHTFGFLVLLDFGAFSVLSTRERRGFWASPPSGALLLALAAGVATGTLLMAMGFPGLVRLPWGVTFAIFGYAAVGVLVINDIAKVAFIKRALPRLVRSAIHTVVPTTQASMP